MARRVVEDLDLGFNEAIKKILLADKASILVGIQEGSKTTYYNQGGKLQNAGQSIAEYAAANEFGTDIIPARSFMRTAFDENLKKIQKIIVSQMGLVVDNKISSKVAYERIGLAMQGFVQRKIREIRYPPNAPYTIAKKKSSKPLIDFGQMLAAVRYVVKRKGVTP